MLVTICDLKGHCLGDFAECPPKPLKFLTKSLFFLKREIAAREPGGKKEFIFPRKKTTKICIWRFLQNTHEVLEKVGQFFQVAIDFHPSHRQIEIRLILVSVL